MGSQFQGPRSGGGGYYRRRARPMSDINVTPMVDVMLVLLIVFMVAAPLLTVGIDVNLPKTSARPMQEDSKPLAVSIDAKGNVYIQDEQVALDELAPRLSAIADSKRDSRIYVRGDEKTSYGRVAEVMGALNGAGFTKVALVTSPPPPQKKK
ncbi:protein TolR [Govanella unica]|uniref:Protein TolR n=1 Tax=Govanella unica TaxID=2975056 RepID=A0A9X3Z864_9PROT|nr:protein TolR [Govania unica]MDA5194912.1 protein TolR [Govania unica]